MPSVIQLKTGTGSAVPSALAQGEVAINIDNGLFYYGSGSGEDVKQLESFTHITASGDISSSGTIIGGALQINGTDTSEDANHHLMFQKSGNSLTNITNGFAFNPSTDTLTLGGTTTIAGQDGIISGISDITASGNVSASGIITTTIEGTGTTTGIETSGYLSSSALYVGDATNFVSASTGNLQGSGNITGFTSMSISYITASQIDVDGETIKLGGESFNKTLLQNVKDGFDSTTRESGGAAFKSGIRTRGTIRCDSHITSSGNISSSGTLSGQAGHLLYDTGSISATGNVQGDILRFGNTTTVAGAIYAHTGSGWVLAHSGSDGNASSSLALAVGTNSTNDGMLMRGMANIGYDPGGENGCALYLESPGSASHVSSTTSGHVVRVVGWNFGTDTIYFNPDNTWILRS